MQHQVTIELDERAMQVLRALMRLVPLRDPKNTLYKRKRNTLTETDVIRHALFNGANRHRLSATCKCGHDIFEHTVAEGCTQPRCVRNGKCKQFRARIRKDMRCDFRA